MALPLATVAAPSWPGVLVRWSVEPGVVVLVAAGAVAYARGWRSLAERGRPLPTRGAAVAYWAGLGVLVLALLSPLDTYSADLLSVHMVQHLLLVLVAAPLLVGSHCTPVLLALLPPPLASRLEALGRSRVARVLTHPVVSWTLFAVTGWFVHFSALFDEALHHPVAHAAEHALFLGTALLFWRPVVGRRPLSYLLRLVYLALAMPQNTFLALAIYSAGHPLYDTYVRLARPWGASVVDDQRLGGGLMWVAGDLTLLVAVLAVAGAWGAHEAGEEDEEPADVPIT